MTIYLINIILLILWALILRKGKLLEQNRKIFCFIATVHWILLSGLRHISVGADTYAYKINRFDQTQYQSWSQLLDNFINVIFKGAMGKDPGYPFIEKIVQIFTVNYQIFLLVIAMIFTIPLGSWFYKNSKNLLMSYLIYSTLFYAFFAITGHRQTIATAFAVLIGYKYVKERRIWPFLILLGISYTIHKSAVIFLLFYFLANKKITKKYLGFISAIIPVVFIMKNQLMTFLGVFMGYDAYTAQYEGAGTWTFTFLLLILTIVTIWRHKLIIENNEQATHYINALILAVIFIPLTFVDPSAMRVVQYFSVFLMLLVPEIINSFSEKDRVIINYISVSLLIILFIRTNPYYLFFWQGY